MCGSASMEEPTGWMRRVGSALRPILGAVENARNLNRVGLYLIDDDVRQGRESELAPPGHAAASAPKIKGSPRRAHSQ